MTWWSDRRRWRKEFRNMPLQQFRENVRRSNFHRADHSRLASRCAAVEEIDQVGDTMKTALSLVLALVTTTMMDER
jgi:hypothetical protein